MMFKSWPQMLLQKLQQSQQNLLSTRVTIINERVRKYIQPLLACWYVGCKLIMSTVKRFSPEFHIFPRSFASRPHIRPLDNFSAANITSLHTSCLEGLFTKYTPSDVLQISYVTSTTLKLLVQNLIQDERGFLLLQRNEHVYLFYKVVPEDNEK